MIGAAPQSVTDFQAFTKMRADARTGENREQNLDEVAKQFESLFIGMMLKQMRKASEGMGTGLLDSKQTQYYREMYDQQVALHLSGDGGFGLAAAIRRQLSGESQLPLQGRSHADYQADPVLRAPAIQSQEVAGQQLGEVQEGGDAQAAFIARMRPHAEAAAGRLGVPAEALIAQAALETGWGRHVMQRADGESSHNLFGIKADQRWSGERVGVSTLEYLDGKPLRMHAEFRAYDSYAESFSDYAEFIAGQPRYRKALQAGDVRGYFQALQDAGYATDPRYADKVLSILGREELQTAAMRSPVATGQG